PGARTPGQVTAFILEGLADGVASVNRRLDVRDANVVLTVPASFSALAREETLDAAVRARFDISRLELIDEPVAALIYLLNSTHAGAILDDTFKNILVFDYGAGTCDLSLVKARYNPTTKTGLEVINLAISPYRKLGGDDIDRAVMANVVWPQLVDDADRGR